MSVPQMIEFSEFGLRFYTRQSEVEPKPILYDKADGIWIDGFWSTEWITESLLHEHLRNKKNVCIVSPDLHGRTQGAFWETLLNYDIDFSRISLCTDCPDEAAKFFASKL